jgi:hypothetical protein
LLSSTATLLFAFPTAPGLVEPEQFRRVLQVLIPSFVFVIAIDYI